MKRGYHTFWMNSDISLIHYRLALWRGHPSIRDNFDKSKKSENLLFDFLLVDC